MEKKKELILIAVENFAAILILCVLVKTVVPKLDVLFKIHQIVLFKWVKFFVSKFHAKGHNFKMTVYSIDTILPNDAI